MRSREFAELRAALRRGGAAPRYIDRTILELSEHCADLEDDGIAAGMSNDEAARNASVMLGSDAAIAAAVLARPELLDWDHRWPRTASCLRSAAAIGALPGMPVVFCIGHRRDIARWATALGAAGILVGSLGTWLNWMITIA